MSRFAAQNSPVPKAPYRGIEPFRYIDRVIFFARDEEAEKLLRQVTIYRGVLVYGDSGAGKSSLINAAFIPAALEENFAPHRLRVQPRRNEEVIVDRLSETAEGGPPYLPSIFASDEASASVVLSLREFKKKLMPFQLSQLEDRLAAKLKEPRDPLSLYLREQLTEEAERLLGEYDEFGVPSEKLLDAMSQELKRFIQDESLYDEQRFAHVGLADETRELLLLNLKGGQRAFLNQLLLESAYPHEPPPVDSYPLLIFDQFEEFVTLFEVAPSPDKIKEALAVQEAILDMIVELLKASSLQVKFLFVFREDYLAKLNKLFERCPELVDQYLRLTPVRIERLDDIIRGPFRQYPGHFKPEFSPELIAKLEQQIKERSESKTINLTELQIACLRLWQSPERTDIFERQGIKGLLEDYLSDAINKFPGYLQDPAVALLGRLVTSSGTRNVVSEEDLIKRVSDEEEIPRDLLEEALKRLEVDTKLIKREQRYNTYFYEIVSEFLVPWISDQKQKRRVLLERRRQAKAQCLRQLQEVKTRAPKRAFIWFIVLAGFWFWVEIYTSKTFEEKRLYAQELKPLQDEIARAKRIRERYANYRRALEEYSKNNLEKAHDAIREAEKDEEFRITGRHLQGFKDTVKKIKNESESSNQFLDVEPAKDSIIDAIGKIDDHLKWWERADVRIGSQGVQKRGISFLGLEIGPEITNVLFAIIWNLLLLGFLLHLSAIRLRIANLYAKAVGLFQIGPNAATTQTAAQGGALTPATGLNGKRFQLYTIGDDLGWTIVNPKPGPSIIVSLCCLVLILLRVSWLGLEVIGLLDEERIKLFKEANKLSEQVYIKKALDNILLLLLQNSLLSVAIFLTVGLAFYFVARWYRAVKSPQQDISEGV